MRLNQILPPEATSDESRLILSGADHLLIEGHKGLLSYDDACIRTRLRQGMLVCLGQNLGIALFSTDDMIITGQIRALEIQR